ncbi:thiamine pyrophosphate-dependent dehydrogenase E1 component subunit alpha [Streptomyces sp. NPDC006285]|uniref:thiamine pyrophosphate-dependent dehydrogenase E1 component subunit alpha n=1 Tax=Streptomyces sp. NPDC006285 TaxID=3364742 RepID=UPI0036AEC789
MTVSLSDGHVLTAVTPPPGTEPVRVLGTPLADEVSSDTAHALYRQMVLARRFNEQATTLTRQGRLAVYPSSTGQEACQVAATAALAPADWLFPTYRDAAAVVSRGVDPVEVLALFRGDWHHGFDSRRHRVAPLCTPLATHCPHAVGLAHAATLAGDDTAALVLLGDGGTSEGDFHEAVNFAAVLRAPVVFLIQNNGYAISVPLHKQCVAPSLAAKGIGYGVPGVQVDGNDAPAVYQEVGSALDRARAGDGPTVIEALTYRLDPHTNADDDGRYRSREEVAQWRQRDPLLLMERHLTESGLMRPADRQAASAAAERMADRLREASAQDPDIDPLELFTHVYARPTPQLAEQRALLGDELTSAARTGGEL